MVLRQVGRAGVEGEVPGRGVAEERILAEVAVDRTLDLDAVAPVPPSLDVSPENLPFVSIAGNASRPRPPPGVTGARKAEPGDHLDPRALSSTIRQRLDYLYIALIVPHVVDSTGVPLQYVAPVRKIV